MSKLMNSDQLLLLENAVNFYLEHLKKLHWEYVFRINTKNGFQEQLQVIESLEEEKCLLKEAKISLSKLFESQFYK